MLIDKTHRSWAMISTVILALGIVSYVIHAGAADKGATGGSLPGLIFGVIGAAMMIFAGLLAARKQVSFWRLGSAQFWLRGHLWLGGLSLPFILFHSGFGFGGVLEQVLMWIFVAVWLSGFYGLAMQHLLPRLLTSRIDRETFLAQVPYIRRRNRIMSDRMVFEHCGPIPITNNPMQDELERLVRHGKKVKDLEAAGKKDEAREEKTKWTEHVDDFDLALFRDIARISKVNGWIRTVNDLTPYLFDVYSVKGVSDLKEKAPAADETAAKKGGSPLDQIRGGGPKKAKSGGSPLDQIRAASGEGSANPAASAPAETGTKSAAKAQQKSRIRPAPVSQFVPDVDSEVTSIERLLVEKYGYGSELAGEVSEYARPFLKRDDEDPDKAVASIQSLLVEKHGYDSSLAEDVAERVRPFLDGTMDASREEETGAESEPASATVAAPPPKAIVPQKKSASKLPILRTKELREFYLGEVRPYLGGDPRRGRLSVARESNRAFSQMRGTLSVELHESLAALQARCDEHRQFAEQERIHHWMHYWLALHIPLSMVLYVLMIVHIVMALRVVPFPFTIGG